jgi:ribosomal peptide maturation radical SAM protein 1
MPMSLKVLDQSRSVSPVRPATLPSFRVALVGMPFGVEVNLPSIQLGLLKAIAEKAGFPADSHHLTLHLADRITPEIYNELCLHRGHMTGEWLFAVAAFGADAPSSATEYLAAFPEEAAFLASVGKDAAWLDGMRNDVLPHFVDQCLDAVDWGQYGVVGFSSTFQQQVASLALARRIKARFPQVRIIFGGANLEGDMGPEHLRAFPFLDYVVVGEGDVAFPTLLCRLAAGETGEDVPGVAARVADQVHYSGQAEPIQVLDELPTPDYDEYFVRAKGLGLIKAGQHLANLPFESSRGCWWGAKHHCTFCGLNAHGMGFRAKSPKRVFAEIDELARKHGVSSFHATDNIVDMKFIKDFFTTIKDARTDYQFFYETKANLTREQIGTLYRGGVRSIQPGIESLSSNVLRLMRKGSTMLQNVRLLKWCRYYGITVFWNLIWGFPGETEQDYREETAVLASISHLQPPTSASRIWLERFAPYFTHQADFPVTDLRPESSYGHVYPPSVDLTKIAYFFEYTMGDTVADEVHEPTRQVVQQWKRSWVEGSADTLVYRRLNDTMFIDDHRACRGGTGRVHTLRGKWATVYEECSESMRTVPQVMEHLRAGSGGLPVRESEIVAGLEAFCAKGLMVSENGHYLSLALPQNPNW